jgi:hypothetical protein
MKTNLEAVKNYSEIQKGDIITNHITNVSATINKTSKLSFGVGIIKEDGTGTFVHYSRLTKGMNEGYISVTRAK